MSALLMPKQGVELEVSSKNIMSVDIPVFTTHTKSQNTNDIYSYGYAYTKMTLTARYRFCRRALPDMLRLAESEKAAAQILAGEIEKTRRRVNALEYVMIPKLSGYHKIYNDEA